MTSTDHLQAGRELDAAVYRRVFGGEPEKRVIRCAFYEMEGKVTDETVVPTDSGFEYEVDWVVQSPHQHWMSFGHRLPAYSTSIEAAWTVVEWMRRPYGLHATFTLVAGTPLLGDSGEYWEARFGQCGSSFAYAKEAATTAPLAICRAALSAASESES